MTKSLIQCYQASEFDSKNKKRTNNETKSDKVKEKRSSNTKIGKIKTEIKSLKGKLNLFKIIKRNIQYEKLNFPKNDLVVKTKRKTKLVKRTFETYHFFV